jgi:hypothetical protein
MKLKSRKVDSTAINADQTEDRHERAQEAAQIAFDRPPKPGSGHNAAIFYANVLHAMFVQSNWK